MTTLICKGSALAVFADPASPFFSKVYMLQMRGNSFREVNSTEAWRTAKRQLGNINRGGKTFALELDKDQYTLAQVASFVTAVNAAVADSIECVSFPAFVEMDDTQYETNVPLALPGSQTFDEEGIVTGRVKWSEWKDSNHDHRKVGAVNYIPLNSVGGRDVAVTALAQLSGAGFTVKEMAQYPASLGEPI